MAPIVAAFSGENQQSMYLGVWRFNARKPALLLGDGEKCASKVSKSGLIYALHGISALGGVLGGASIILSFLFGWPSIIAVILNYVTRDNARGTWLDSHWRWQLRTFWLTAAWTLAAALLFLTLIGIPLALLIVAVISLWLLYRVIRGWLALADRRPMPRL